MRKSTIEFTEGAKKETIKERCFLHNRFKSFAIPTEINGQQVNIVFNNWTYCTTDKSIIEYLQTRVVNRMDIVEIPAERRQEAIGLLKAGQASAGVVARLLAVR